MPKQWSTKHPEILQSPDGKNPGVARFHFTDDYSVFHFSKMPDQIPRKGEAVCTMAAHSLSLIEKAGIPTHLRRVCGPGSMEVEMLRILYPQHGEIGPGERNYVIPLQVVCRSMLPEGASVFRRLAMGELQLESLSLSSMPKPGIQLDEPIIEFTTKREEIDRFITKAEAQGLACLSDEQFAEVKRVTLEVNRVISENAHRVGLVHADSKIELGVNAEGRIIVVDTVGTPDENRFLINGFHVTKQVLRNYYLVRGLETQVQNWCAEGKPRSEWPRPESLPPAYVEAASHMYGAICDRWTGRNDFEAPLLESVVESIRTLQARYVNNLEGRITHA